MIVQESAGVVVVGGAGWGPPAKLYYRPGWHVEVGNLGAVAIKPVEVVVEILLEAGQLQERTLVLCLLRVFNEFIVLLVPGLQ